MFRKAEFPQVKIYGIPDNNKTRYKINATHTEKYLLTLFISIVENLLTGKTSINNDVIKWLPSFSWEMNIVLFISFSQGFVAKNTIVFCNTFCP